VVTEEKTMNSQNIPLLAAVAAFDPSSPENDAEDASVVGDSAFIPDAGPEGGLADVDHQEENNGQISIYVVRSGDSFASIAKMFNVSVNTILWANNLPKGAKLAIGQTLVILPVSGVKHTVQKGDTIASIAKKYKADPDEIRSYNGIDSELLALDTVVIVPDGEIPFDGG
jgi:LysM repeat protein